MENGIENRIENRIESNRNINIIVRIIRMLLVSIANVIKFAYNKRSNKISQKLKNQIAYIIMSVEQLQICNSVHWLSNRETLCRCHQLTVDIHIWIASTNMHTHTVTCSPMHNNIVT